MVTVNPLPTATISGTQTICKGQSAVISILLTGTGPWDFTYSTTNSGGTTNTTLTGQASNPFTITVSPTETSTYTMVSVNDANCTGTVSGTSVVVSVDTPPNITLGVSAAVSPLCNGGSTTIDVANSENGVSYQLKSGVTNIGGPIVGNGATISLPTGSLGATATFNVMATRGVCSLQLTNSATVTVNGTINAGLTVTPQSPSVCSGSGSNIQVLASEVGVSYQLRDNSTNALVGSAVAGTGATIDLPSGILIVSTTFNILASNVSCSVQLTNLAAVNVDINPSAGLALGSTIDPLCSGGSSDITIAGSEVGVSYQLRDNSNNSPIGAAVAGTGASINLPTGNLFTTTTFNVLATGGAACAQVQLTGTIAINVAGTINAGLVVSPQSAAVCSGSGTNIQIANSEAGVNYQLRDNSTNANVGGVVAGDGSMINLPTGNLIVATTYNILASNGTCSIQLTSLPSVSVDVNPNITLITAASIDPVCTGGSSTITILTSEVGVSYQLRDASNANVGSPVAGTGGTINLPTGVLAATTTFNVFASSGVCTSVQLTNTVTVNVGGTLNTGLTIAAQSPTICQGAGTNIQIANSEIGVTYQLRDNSNNSIIGAVVNGSGATIDLPTGSLTVTTTYNILASNGSCSIQMTTLPTVTVDILPSAALGVTAQSTSVCNGTGTNIQVANSELGVSYQLRNNSDNSLIGASVIGTGATINLPTGNLTTNLTVNVLATGGTCSVQLTAISSITVLLASDPLCSGSTNCGAFTIVATESRPTCAGKDDGTITLTVSGGTPNYIATLSDLALGFNQALTGSGPFTYSNLSPSLTYQYTIKDAAGNTCTLPYSLPIQTNVQAVASDFVDAKCFNQAVGQATLTVTSGGASPYEYSTDAGINWVSFNSPVTITNLMPAAAPYQILVRNDASDLCPSQPFVTINNAVADIAITTTVTNATCNNNDGSIQIDAVTGGTAPYTFKLDGVTITLPANNIFAGLSGGNHTVSVIDANSCSKDFIVPVLFPGYVDFIAFVIDPDCSGNGSNGGIIVAINSFGTFQVGITTDPVNPPTTFVDVISNGTGTTTFSNLKKGSYQVYVKSTTSLCPAKMSADIKGGPDQVDFTLSSSDIVCFESKSAVVLSSIIGSSLVNYNYEILNQGLVAQSGSFTNLQALGNVTLSGLGKGDYQIRVFQDQSVTSGCVAPITSAFKTFSIAGPDQPLDTLFVRKTISYPDLATGTMLIGIKESKQEPYEVSLELVAPLFPSQSFVMDWKQAQRSSQTLKMEFTAQNLFAGDYQLSIRDALGCVKTFPITIAVDTNLEIPNIFTPNGDGVNESFYIRNLPLETKLIITNRWGKEVYSASDYKNDWMAENVSDGMYYYRIVVNGEAITGWVEILR